MTSTETAGIDSLLKEIRKYTEGSSQRPGEYASSGYRPSAVNSTPASAGYSPPSSNQVRPGFEPPRPNPVLGQQKSPAAAEPPRPPPAPRSPLQGAVDRKPDLGLDDILAKISSVTGIRKEGTPSKTPSVLATSANIQQPSAALPTRAAPPPNNYSNQPPRPAAPFDPAVPTNADPARRSASEGADLSSRERYHAELARLDAEISKFKASMQGDGSGNGPQKPKVDTAAPPVTVSKMPTSFSQPVTPKARSGSQTSYMLHPDGDISQVGSGGFEGAKDDLQKSISRMQEALKMSREMRAQLVPDTPTKAGERRASDTGPVRASPGLMPGMPLRSAPSPLLGQNSLSQSIDANGKPPSSVVPPWERNNNSTASSPWARPAENRTSAPAEQQRYYRDQNEMSAPSYQREREPYREPYREPDREPYGEREPYMERDPYMGHTERDPYMGHTERDPYMGHTERLLSDPQGAAPMRHAPPQQSSSPARHAPPPPPEAQRQQPGGGYQSSRPPLPEQQQQPPPPHADMHQQRIQAHLQTEINNYPVDPTARQHLQAMIQDGSIRSSKELRAYIEQQFRTGSFPSRAPPPPQHNLSRSVDHAAPPPQYGRAGPRGGESDADILSRSFDEINRLAAGMPPPGASYMTAPPRPPLNHGGGYYPNNRGPSPMQRRPGMSPGPMHPDQYGGGPQRLSAGPMQDHMHMNPPYGMQQHRQAYPPPAQAHMPSPYRNNNMHRDPSPGPFQRQQYSPPQTEQERAYIPLSEVPQDIAASLINEGYSQGAML